jgi:ribosome-associated toxin RatA of RatAB toxin-antitoxin module
MKYTGGKNKNKKNSIDVKYVSKPKNSLKQKAKILTTIYRTNIKFGIIYSFSYNLIKKVNWKE